MIPRKEAKRLLAEYVAALEASDAGAHPGEVARKLLAESDLVLRGKENVQQKARRLLAEGRLTIERAYRNGLVVATCRGDTGSYDLGWDPDRREWRCTCPVVGPRCAHIAALQLVSVRAPTPIRPGQRPPAA